MHYLLGLKAEVIPLFKSLLCWIHDNASYYVPTAAFVVSICSLLFTAVSFRGTKRSGDLTSLIKFVETLQAAEKAFMSESNDSEKDDRFIELINILEAYCAAYNANLLQRKTKELVRDKIIDSVALINRYPIWLLKFSDAKIGDTSLSELARFEKSHQKKIRTLAGMLALRPSGSDVA